MGLDIFGRESEREEVKLQREILQAIREQSQSLRYILETQQHTLCVLEKIWGDIRPRRASSIKLAFGGNMSATPGTIAVGATVTGTIVPLEADGVTVTPGAVVSAQAYSVDDSSLVSFVTNSDGSATFTGVAAGTATVTATATVTDASGTVNSFTTTNTLVVTGGTATGVTAGIQLNFA